LEMNILLQPSPSDPPFETNSSFPHRSHRRPFLLRRHSRGACLSSCPPPPRAPRLLLWLRRALLSLNMRVFPLGTEWLSFFHCFGFWELADSVSNALRFGFYFPLFSAPTVVVSLCEQKGDDSTSPCSACLLSPFASRHVSF